jgi:hypothetical protein
MMLCSADKSPVGKIAFEIDGITTPENDGDNALAAYYFSDEDSSWNQIYGNNALTCTQKLSHAIKRKNATYTGTLVYPWVHPECSSPSEACWTNVTTVYQGVRPRFWYVVVAHHKKLVNGDCVPVHIPKYNLTMVNLNSKGDIIQIGVDEYGVLQAYILAVVVWGIGLVVHLVAHIKYSDVQSPILRLFHASFILMFIALVCHVIHWVTYYNNGVGIPTVELLADVFQVLSVVSIWFMLAFLSEGYGITRHLMSENSARKMIGAASIGSFGIAYVAMQLWYYFGRDEAATTYIYDSAGGIIVLVVQIIYAVWCGYNLVSTYGKEDGSLKRNWYIVCLCVFGFFFASTPVIAVIAVFLDPWVQYKVVVIAVLCVNSIVYGSAVLLFFPSISGEIFKLKKGLANFSDDISGYEHL